MNGQISVPNQYIQNLSLGGNASQNPTSTQSGKTYQTSVDLGCSVPIGNALGNVLSFLPEADLRNVPTLNRSFLEAVLFYACTSQGESRLPRPDRAGYLMILDPQLRKEINTIPCKDEALLADLPQIEKLITSPNKNETRLGVEVLVEENINISLNSIDNKSVINMLQSCHVALRYLASIDPLFIVNLLEGDDESVKEEINNGIRKDPGFINNLKEAREDGTVNNENNKNKGWAILGEPAVSLKRMKRWF